jgi:hypothetical protein
MRNEFYIILARITASQICAVDGHYILDIQSTAVVRTVLCSSVQASASSRIARPRSAEVHASSQRLYFVCTQHEMAMQLQGCAIRYLLTAFCHAACTSTDAFTVLRTHAVTVL